MKNKIYRHKQGVKEIDRCYLCNNKAQIKCKVCKQKICNDCLEHKNCYKCNIIDVDQQGFSNPTNI